MLMHAAPHQHSAPTCVWMDAGLMSYRLCDRSFDCEHCPLDAALQGLPQPITIERSTAGGLGRGREHFPDDRLYGPGHTWLRPPDERGRVRLGIDSFAASLLSPPLRLKVPALPRLARRGQFLCGIELDCGSVHLVSPLDARIAEWNCVVSDNPGALIHSPYDAGWIADLWPLDGEALSDCLSGPAAARRARLDFRRLLRRIGQHLLLDDTSAEASASDGGVETDLRRIIGGEEFLHLLEDSLQCSRRE